MCFVFVFTHTHKKKTWIEMFYVCVCAGAWLKSSLGYVQREGKQLTFTYIAPQLGYWVAAMSPINTGNTDPFLGISQFCLDDSAFFDLFLGH